MRAFRVGEIEIGVDRAPLVIPEIGINHGGSLKTAKLMVDAAARSGAKIVKHQTHVVEDEMSAAARRVIPGNDARSIYEIMETCALSEADERDLMRYAESKGLLFLSTPFSRAAADRLEAFGVKGYKIGSGEMNNHPLLEHVASFGKPMIVSTGMNDLAAIERAAAILARRAVPYALLHTTNLYPTAPEQVRLGAMRRMMERFPDVPVGLSDHTRNNNACVAALALGAAIVERHFTDRKDRAGGDIVCSMDEGDLKELIQAAREVFLMRGGEKEALAAEQVTMDFAFATVVAIAPIRAGGTFSRDNLWVKRPGTGEIPAADYEKILGRKAARDVPAGAQICGDMVAGRLWNG
jgi:sialic acid synthase SpsE